jgi:hypothetical protein
MMHFRARFISSFAALALLAITAGTCAQAQNTATQSTSGPQTAGNGTYIAIDPLALVRYDNRYDVSLSFAYDHIKAGPTVLQGSNLGGLDAEGSYWFSKHWGVEATGRYYLGTSGVGSVGGGNSGANLIKGPFVSEELFAGGAEWLGPHNKHGALIAHAMVGGAHFDSHVFPDTPQTVGFYNDQTALAAIIGGHMDLNRSAHWVFRITPDAVMTHYGIDYPPSTKQFDVNFAISVGIEYKFKKKR